MTTTNQPLRLLVAGLSWPPETFLARLLRGLAASGIEVTVACGARPDPEWLNLPNFVWLQTQDDRSGAAGRLLQTGGHLGRAVVAGNGDVRRYRAGAEGWADVRRWLPFAGRAWDVIYFPWNAGAIAYRPLFDVAPVVISCRGAQVNIAPHNPQRAEIRDGLRETFTRAAAVHCVSDAIRDEAVQYGLDPTKAVVIRPAIDPGFFKPSDEPRDPKVFRLVTTGSLIWRKGHEYLLQAVAYLRDEGIPVRLEIIGDGPDRQRLIYTIHDLGLCDHVELPGKLAPDVVLARLQSADVFVLSSLSEGISNAALEGMACGLPVVTTACGGMPEAVTDSVEGVVVPTRDARALAAGLGALWRSPETRTRMGEAGRARVLSDFRLEGQVERFIALFREVSR